MTHRVLFYVQHLLGIGHLKRAAAIVAAMSSAGLDVTVAHGGTVETDLDYPGAKIGFLPAATILGNAFSGLVDETGAPVDAEWKARRRDALLRLAAECEPHVVLIELFPFGRRQFRFELLPLIEAMRARTSPPAILSSVRDILVRPKRRERETETAELVNAAFDAILVHGDPAFVPFGDSFGETKAIAERLRYTGYVGQNLGPGGEGDGAGANEVVVSAGGGAAGLPLLTAAVEARGAGAAKTLDWRIITGPRLPDRDFETIGRRAKAIVGGGRVAVERFRSDFPAVLSRAALSVSQGGYNTTIDLLRSGVPALVVPFAADAETEQTERSRRLAERGYIAIVTEAEMAGGALVEAIEAALADAPRRRAMPPVDFALDGAAETARIVAAYALGRA